MTTQRALNEQPFDVLVVDDQPMIFEAVRRMLAGDTRVRVHGCRLATEALTRATDLQPAVILQDLKMPDGDGLDLVATYRATPALEGCAVVVLSGTTDPTVKALAFERGANDYIEKLPPASEFIARVHHHAQASMALVARNTAMRAIEEKDRELLIRNAMLDEANDRLKRANQELVVDLGTQRKKVEALAAAGSELAQIQDLDLLLITILNEAAHFSGASSGAVFVKEGEELRVATTYEHGSARASSARTPRTCVDRATVIGSTAVTGHALRVGRDSNTDHTSGIRLRDRSVAGVLIAADGVLSTSPTSLLVLPIVRTETVLGVLALFDAGDADGFGSDDERLLRHFSALAAVAIERAQAARALLMRMVQMAALRDPKETGEHVQRVAEISAILFEAWAAAHNIPSDVKARQLDQLRYGAMCHDLGKVGISDAILKKPGKLDDAERQAMQRHCEIGVQLFSGLRSAEDETAAAIVHCHQERWDGAGYPRQLRGEEIPLAARIVAVADVYDALGSRRSYKDPWPREKIEALFREEAGKHFDPEISQILLDQIEAVERVRDTFVESDSAGS